MCVSREHQGHTCACRVEGEIRIVRKKEDRSMCACQSGFQVRLTCNQVVHPHQRQGGVAASESDALSTSFNLAWICAPKGVVAGTFDLTRSQADLGVS